MGKAAQDGHPVPVQPLHLLEVGGGLGLALEEGLHEPLLVVPLQVLRPPGVAAFVPHGGGREGPKRLAAGGARPVAGPDLDVVGKGEELFLEAPKHPPRPGLRRALDPRRLFQKVRPAHVPHEDEVPREEEEGLVRHRPVRHQEGEVLGGVARGVDRPDADVPHLELVPVLEEDVGEAPSALVLPVLVPLVGEVQGGPRGPGELPRPREVVGVDVGLGDGGDAEAQGLGELQVHVHVPPGVHHQGLPGGGAAQEVAHLREAFLVDLAKDHGFTSGEGPLSLLGAEYTHGG